LTASTALFMASGSIILIGLAIYYRSIYHDRARVIHAIKEEDPWDISTSFQLSRLLRRNLLGVFLGSIGFIGILAGVILQQQSAAKPLEERMSKLSSSLQESAKAVDEAQAEIEARQRLVDKLRSDQQTYERLRGLNKPTLDAVAVTLQGELAKAERRARLFDYLVIPSWGALLGLLFYVGYEKIQASRG
jgi:hypothetical protein